MQPSEQAEAFLKAGDYRAVFFLLEAHEKQAIGSALLALAEKNTSEEYANLFREAGVLAFLNVCGIRNKFSKILNIEDEEEDENEDEDEDAPEQEGIDILA